MKTWLCPIHRTQLTALETKYGTRFQCPELGCTVACWDGETSTPADAETRQERHRTHAVFDALWRGPQRRMRRYEAYRWLEKVLGRPHKTAHIGMCTAEECKAIQAAVKTLTAPVGQQQENQV